MLRTYIFRLLSRQRYIFLCHTTTSASIALQGSHLSLRHKIEIPTLAPHCSSTTIQQMQPIYPCTDRWRWRPLGLPEKKKSSRAREILRDLLQISERNHQMTHASCAYVLHAHYNTTPEIQLWLVMVRQGWRYQCRDVHPFRRLPESW